MRSTRLILIRHGHTAGNRRSGNLMSGWTDCPLTPLGWRQTRALCERMASEPPAVARYSSPLRRASDTAHALSCLPLGPVHLVDELKEICCGEVDGWPVSEVQRRYPALWDANLRQDDDCFRWPGGESYRELRRRSFAGIERIAAAHPGERVIVVTHAGVISQIAGMLHGVPAAVWGKFRPENCSLSEIEWGKGARRLVRFNDHAHLAGLSEEPETSTHPPGE